MELTLERYDRNSERTIGKLMVDFDTKLFGYTAEDPVRTGPKIPHHTAIPAGRYRIVVTDSQRFKRKLPLLLDVPGFSGVRIHPGNGPDDTDGCILVGLGRTTDLVTSSRLACENLQHAIEHAIGAGDQVWITITN